MTWFVADRLDHHLGRQPRAHRRRHRAHRRGDAALRGLLAAQQELRAGVAALHARAGRTAALAKGTRSGVLFAMAAVSFLAVYRELFEIVLFYQALWVQAGAVGRRCRARPASRWRRRCWRCWPGPSSNTACACRSARSSPVTAWLLALLAVVFAGHGVAALQEAGVLDASPVCSCRFRCSACTRRCKAWARSSRRSRWC